MKNRHIPFWALFTLLVLGMANGVFAQFKVKVVVVDSLNLPVHYANVDVIEGPKKRACTTGPDGKCEMALPMGDYKFRCKYTNYKDVILEYKIESGKNNLISFKLTEENILELETQEISTKEQNKQGFERAPLSPALIRYLPLANPSIEQLLLFMPGVFGAGEFSSQYRVRGGNFDENLVYINDIEVYRPMLVRSGQQEGLGITNSNLTKDIQFSTGGFQAQFADKLSSVLNITYKTPNKLHGSAELGILTASFNIEGSSKNKEDSTQAGRFSFLVGGRRFSTQYLLKTLDAKGTYNPNALDLQSVFTLTPKLKNRNTMVERERGNGVLDTIYMPKDKLKMSLFGIVSYNRYIFNPKSQETSFGTFGNPLRLYTAFVGQEKTNFLTGQAALTIEHRPNLRFFHKHILSTVISEESEVYDVEGGYRLADIEVDFDKSSFNQVVDFRGVGSEIRHARNYLNIKMFSYTFKGELNLDKNFYKNLSKSSSYTRHKLDFGVRAQVELIDDRLKEWRAIDSVEYITMKEVVVSNNSLSSVRFSGFVQETWRTSKTTQLTVGVRGQYWTLNNQFFASPRAQFLWSPLLAIRPGDSLYDRRNYQLRVAVGSYDQMPFYRDIRDWNGNVYKNTKAQRSVHAILGFDYVFKIRRRYFKLFAEAYYKHIWRLIPYQIENVRVRYFPTETGKGYAYGLDVRLNGQFIPGIESWLSLSYLKTMENVTGDSKGWVVRPSDQRINISFSFQDEVPRFPFIKMNINLIYNTGLPFGPPRSYDNRTSLRAPGYFRVDLGISGVIKFKTRTLRKKKFGFDSLWLGLDLFNVFARANTISYQWVSDVYGTQFAVPNYLSQRLLNIRAVLNF